MDYVYDTMLFMLAYAPLKTKNVSSSNATASAGIFLFRY